MEETQGDQDVAAVFFSYSHADEGLRDELEKQLSMMKHQGLIETWHDRRIGAGEEFAAAIDERINKDEIILLLVSPDFLASRYCYEIEMQRAMERHERREAIVIPVILRPCDWHHAPFGKLNATPRDGLPVTKWASRDEAFLEVAKAVRAAVTRLGPSPTKATTAAGRMATVPQASSADAPGSSPRSSNLRLAKTFSDRDKDRFRIESFEYMARYFENSLNELGTRNPGFEGVFRRVDTNRFFATIYRDGKAMARCTVFMGGYLNAICYVEGERSDSNTSNAQLSVEADDQSLFLAGFGARVFGDGRAGKLSEEGAAEHYWEMLISRLQ